MFTVMLAWPPEPTKEDITVILSSLATVCCQLQTSLSIRCSRTGVLAVGCGAAEQADRIAVLPARHDLLLWSAFFCKLTTFTLRWLSSGRHYLAFFYSKAHDQWLIFDDKRVNKVCLPPCICQQN